MTRLDPSALAAYVIVDPVRLGAQLSEVVGAILGAGVRTIQLRDKSPNESEDRAALVESARLLRQLTRQHDALLIINDDWRLAVEVGADGVHVGPNDTPVDVVRKEAPALIVGASSGTVARALELEAQGADYLGCGAIWRAQASKPNASAPRGLEMIRAIADAVAIPIVGIGGVTLDRAPSVIDAGAAGVAVIRAVLDAPDPARAARDLVAATAS